MTLALAIAVVVLMMAVVTLFAMLGQLVSRLPETVLAGASREVHPLEEARLGAAAVDWPDPLRLLAEDTPSCLLVLSTVCASCDDVSRQLASFEPVLPTAVLVSCSEYGIGEAYVERYELGRFPFYVDQGGAWVNTNFGVQTSPTALVFAEGSLRDALLFQDVSELSRRLQTQPRELITHG